MMTPKSKCGSIAGSSLPPASPEKEVHGCWTTPPCLTVLGKREYLPLRHPRITQDHQEVQREEMVALAIVLQRCAICAGASPNTFCRAVQGLCKWLAHVVEDGCLANMEMMILDGLGRASWLPLL